MRYEINRAKVEYIAQQKQPSFSAANPLQWYFAIAPPASMHHFQRQGDNWYRNPEFGMSIEHPNKRWDAVIGAGGDETGIFINHSTAPFNPCLVDSLYAGDSDGVQLFKEHYKVTVKS